MPVLLMMLNRSLQLGLLQLKILLMLLLLQLLLVLILLMVGHLHGALVLEYCVLMNGVLVLLVGHYDHLAHLGLVFGIQVGASVRPVPGPRSFTASDRT